MTDWRPSSLAELIDIKHGFAFKGQHFVDYETDDVLVTPGNFAIGGGFKSDKLKYYDGPVAEDYVLHPGDLIVTMTDLSKQADTLGYSAIVPKNGPRLLHNQRIGLVTSKDKAVGLDFLGWLMRTPAYRNCVVGSATGSTVKHTSPSRIKEFEFLLPPEHERNSISTTLNALDDKIELNRRMNETLEAQARALFRDWFVDFGPVKAKMAGAAPHLAPDLWSLFPDRLNENGVPEGWSISQIRDALRLSYGKSLPARERRPGSIPVYGSGGVSGTHDIALIEGPTVIVGRKGTVGSLFYEPRPSFPIDTVFYVEPKMPLVFCFELLSSFPLGEMNTDAAVPGLNRENVYRLEFAIPPDDLVTQFATVASALRRKIDANFAESETLAQTRDLLLPKLMSGEIRVGNVERELETAS